MKTTILFLCASALVSGCTSLSALKGEQAGKLYDRDGTDVIAESASVRLMFFKDKDTQERYCLAPGPDVSVASSEGVSVGTPGRNVGASAGEAAFALGGRSPSVLMVRELMYRACELALNINASPTETKEIYFRFLSSATELTKALGPGTAGGGSVVSNVTVPASAAPTPSGSATDPNSAAAAAAAAATPSPTAAPVFQPGQAPQ